MHPNYPIWPFHNFDRRRTLDHTIHQFYRDRYGPLLERLEENLKEWQQLYPGLIKCSEKDSSLQSAVRTHHVVFQAMCRIVRTHYTALPEAHTLDIKLSLLSDLLQGDEEEKIMAALGISANHPALQDRSFNAAVRKALVKTQFRKIFSLLLNNLKKWLK